VVLPRTAGGLSVILAEPEQTARLTPWVIFEVLRDQTAPNQDQIPHDRAAMAVPT
jgi:hypothetical protein